MLQFSSSCVSTKLELSNQGEFVILVVDGSSRLVVGMQSKQLEVPSGKLRIALGGILIDKEKIIVQVQHFDRIVFDQLVSFIRLVYIMILFIYFHRQPKNKHRLFTRTSKSGRCGRVLA